MHDFSLKSGERKIANSLDKIRHDHLVRYFFVRDTVNLFKLNNTFNILDIFCGNGYGSSILSEIDGAKIHSIDGSIQAINLAKIYYNKKNILFECKEFPFNFKENYYDFICSMESIEHIDNDLYFLECISNSLKKNGILIISTPNQEKIPLEQYKNKFHKRHYIISNFIDVMSTFRFEIIFWGGQNCYNKHKNKLIYDMQIDDKIYNFQSGDFSIFVFRKI